MSAEIDKISINLLLDSNEIERLIKILIFQLEINGNGKEEDVEEIGVNPKELFDMAKKSGEKFGWLLNQNFQNNVTYIEKNFTQLHGQFEDYKKKSDDCFKNLEKRMIKIENNVNVLIEKINCVMELSMSSLGGFVEKSVNLASTSSELTSLKSIDAEMSTKNSNNVRGKYNLINQNATTSMSINGININLDSMTDVLSNQPSESYLSLDNSFTWSDSNIQKNYSKESEINSCSDNTIRDISLNNLDSRSTINQNSIKGSIKNSPSSSCCLPIDKNSNVNVESLNRVRRESFNGYNKKGNKENLKSKYRFSNELRMNFEPIIVKESELFDSLNKFLGTSNLLYNKNFTTFCHYQNQLTLKYYDENINEKYTLNELKYKVVYIDEEKIYLLIIEEKRDGGSKLILKIDDHVRFNEVDGNEVICVYTRRNGLFEERKMWSITFMDDSDIDKFMKIILRIRKYTKLSI